MVSKAWFSLDTSITIYSLKLLSTAKFIYENGKLVSNGKLIGIRIWGQINLDGFYIDIVLIVLQTV